MKLHVLRETDNITVFHGADVFKAMDSWGLLLEMIIQKVVFDWLTFIMAAEKSGNYSRAKLESVIREAWQLLLGESLDQTDFQERITLILHAVYSKRIMSCP